MKQILLGILTVAVVGCSGDDGGSGGGSGADGGSGGSDSSGVDPSTKAVGLSSADAMKLCEYTSSKPNRHVECGDGQSFDLETKTLAACLSSIPTNPACTATVGDYEGCANAFATDSDAVLCSALFPPECETVVSSACVGS
ncbi:MAG TPA: hypothetical protein VGM90_36920 [Kofleriaceae bacterium]